jgi:hypothetical protein
MVGTGHPRTAKSLETENSNVYDIRPLNSVTTFDPYPLPVFDEYTSKFFDSGILQSWTVFADFDRSKYRTTIRRELALQSLLGIMNSIDCTFVFPTAPQISSA